MFLFNLQGKVCLDRQMLEEGWKEGKEILGTGMRFLLVNNKRRMKARCNRIFLTFLLSFLRIRYSISFTVSLLHNNLCSTSSFRFLLFRYGQWSSHYLILILSHISFSFYLNNFIVFPYMCLCENQPTTPQKSR